jgi:hypothetical protein
MTGSRGNFALIIKRSTKDSDGNDGTKNQFLELLRRDAGSYQLTERRKLKQPKHAFEKYLLFNR